MRTSLPQSERKEKAVKANISEAADYPEWRKRSYPQARRIAVMSLIPGLGQLRNGELGKGLLFMAVSATNLAFIIACIFRDQVTALLSSAALALHRQPNWDLGAPFQAALVGSPASFIYVALLVLFVSYAVRDAYDKAAQKIRNGKHVEAFAFALPEATSGSYLVHFAIIVSCALLVICFLTPVPPKQQVTHIELVKEDKPPEPLRPRPPAPREKPKPVEQPKPQAVKPQPVKVEPPKPTPVAIAVPTDKPTDLTTTPGPVPTAAAPPAPAAPSAGGGGGSAAGDGGGGGGDIDMGPYMRELQRRIKKSWWPPKGNESKRIKVAFKVHKDGTISKLKLAVSSGVDVADEAATQAVENAAPFAPLPDGAGDDIDINFTFDYTVFGGGRGSFH